MIKHKNKEMENRLEISVSKNKNIGLIILGALLTLVGYTQSLFGLLYFAKGISYIFLGLGAITLIGGIIAFVALKGSRLILTKKILIYSPQTSLSVKWTEIEGYTDYSLNNVHTLRVNLKDPEAYIAKQDQSRQKKLRMLMKLHDTPVIISSPTFLEISKAELKEALLEYLVKYGNS